jgi:Bacterial RNA polymerase, alpha chain C terminal domain
MVKEDKYYEIAIEKLGLSVSAINQLERLGVTTVGDCVDFHRRVRDGNTIGHAPTSFFRIMLGEVKEKLVEHGYWQVSIEDFVPDIIEELKQALTEKGYLPLNNADTKKGDS